MFQIIKDHTAGIDYVKDDVLHVGDHSGVLIRTDADLDELPEYKPGTMAHTAGWKAAWEMSADGEWVNIIGGDVNGG